MVYQLQLEDFAFITEEFSKISGRGGATSCLELEYNKLI